MNRPADAPHCRENRLTAPSVFEAEDRTTPQGPTDRQPAVPAEPGGEQVLERLAQYARWSALLGIGTNVGIVFLIILVIALEKAEDLQIAVPEWTWGLLSCLGGYSIIMAGIVTLILGGLGCDSRNTANRSLAVLGICLGGVVLVALYFYPLIWWILE